ncbi:MAG: hypothetical protein WCD65_01420, partial [Pseudolabrys sp.]
SESHPRRRDDRGTRADARTLNCPTAFQLLRGPGAGGPGASGLSASGLCTASAPLITSLVPACAPLITSLVPTCAPLVTPFHTGRLGFSI